MPMQKIQKQTGFGRGTFAVMVFGVLALSLLLANYSRAGEVYSWETADGNVAFTDNPKNVPARYRDEVQVRKSAGIGDYARFTAEDSAESGRYSDQLAKRLDYLRWSNGDRTELCAHTLRELDDFVGQQFALGAAVDLRPGDDALVLYVDTGATA